MAALRSQPSTLGRLVAYSAIPAGGCNASVLSVDKQGYPA
jgi:hypothetical protein